MVDGILLSFFFFPLPLSFHIQDFFLVCLSGKRYHGLSSFRQHKRWADPGSESTCFGRAFYKDIWSTPEPISVAQRGTWARSRDKDGEQQLSLFFSFFSFSFSFSFFFSLVFFWAVLLSSFFFSLSLLLCTGHKIHTITASVSCKV
jgi:hypothetical protein